MFSKKNDRGNLTKGSEGRLLVQLTIPMILGLLAIMIFNVVDTYFVGKLGTFELAAMSFTFPVVQFIGSLILGLGVGLSSLVARTIGAGDRKAVRAITRDSLIFGILLVILIAVSGLALIEPLFRMLGADDVMLPLIKSYMRIWFIGTPFLVLPMVGNAAINGAGDTRSPAVIMMVSGGLNVILDPIFIFGFAFVPAMGIAGAAIASVISRSLTLVFSLLILIKRENMLEMRLPKPAQMVKNWGQMLTVGAPAALTNVLVPVSLALLTRMIAGYGPAAVGAFGAGGRVHMLAMMVPVAFADACTPFIGQNFGAKKHGRICRAVKLSNRFMIAWGSGIYLVIALLADPIASVFSKDPSVISSMKIFLQMGFWGIILDGMTMVTSASFNGMGLAIKSTILNVLRMFVLLIPFAAIGSYFWGETGLYMGHSVSLFLAGGIAYLWLGKILRKWLFRGDAANAVSLTESPEGLR